MLRVAKVRRGGHAYYLEVAGNGAGTGIEAPGRWLGSGRGRARTCTARWTATPSGRCSGATIPHTGAAAGPCPRPGQGGRIRPQLLRAEVGEHAPRLRATRDRQIEVLAAHEHAVDAALDYVERRAVAVRRPIADGTLVPVEADAVARPASCTG